MIVNDNIFDRKEAARPERKIEQIYKERQEVHKGINDKMTKISNLLTERALRREERKCQ